ncbi:MAG TPA: hypothetical protein VN752_00750 [Solirubrobacterales bacterium]|nr:hypothetical protein [Solirubrobacterales bacterium]
MRARLLLGISAFALALGLSGGELGERAEAKTPILSFGATSVNTQAAGGHPDLHFSFLFGEDLSPCGDCDGAKEITVNSAPGLLGAPRDIPRCTLAQFSLLDCPIESQVGLVCLSIRGAEPGPGCTVMPLFNMVPKGGQAALLAFPAPVPSNTLSLPVFISFTARTESDYGLETKTLGIPRRVGAFPVAPRRVEFIFWGVPADPSHDALRMPPEGFEGESEGDGWPLYLCRDQDALPALLAGRFPYPDCANILEKMVPAPTPSNAPLTPFISNPTNCAGELNSSVETLAYDGETDFASSSFPATTGCDKLTFNPSLVAKPTTTEADSPSGLDATLTVPQTLSGTVPTPSAIKATTVQLPPGFTINPNAADGKVACTAAQARFGTREEAQCPEHAKIGSLAVTSSSLPEVLRGSMYLGEPLPGNRYRVFLVFDGFSLHVKLPGTARPDPLNGMTVSFENLPQFTFQEFDMHVFGSERGALATPTRCGTYPIKASFTPWASELPTQSSTQFFTIDSGPNGTPCPGAQRPFAPSFQAGVTKNTGGAHSPFIVEISRADGDQFLAAANVSPPAGFSGILKGIPYCPEAAIAQLGNPLYSGLAELSSSVCPQASQIGSVTGGAGAGSRVLYQSGKAYLAGPYKGAPLSIVVVIPAVTGPYDVGNIATRVAVHVDPVTARVKTVSDPLPLQIDGIPLRVRSVRVDIDRPKFALNPTNCKALSSDAELFGEEGAKATRTSHFQLANCANLPFEPKLSLRLRGGTKRGDHPVLRAVLKARPGDANLSFASVALPRSEFLDQAHIKTICTRVQFAAKSCPAGSIYGKVTATTPILDQPLQGPVYLRSSSNELPDLVMDLHGQVDFTAVGRVDSIKGGIRNTFDFIPDVPVSQIVLQMQGGAKGLLQNSRDLCKSKVPKATVRFKGQNGAKRNLKVPLQAACKKKRAR